MEEPNHALEIISPLDQHQHRRNPAGGRLHSWLKVAGGFFIFMNIWGLPISFGAFQSFYTLQYLPEQSSSAISWIGTIQGALLVIMGLVAGPIFDLGYYRLLVITGSFLTVFGMMMLSLSTEYYQVFLSQGICVGIGCGLLYIPTLSLISSAFTDARAIAMGVVTSGIALGGIIYTIVFLELLPRIGFPWTIRTMAFLNLFAFVVAACTLLGNTPKVGGKVRSLFDRRALQDVPFLLFAVAQFFIFLGYLVPLFYIPTFAQVVLHADESLALYLLVASQAASLIGRLAAAVLAHYCGVMIPWILCCGISAVLCFAWIAAKDLGSFVAFCVLYGLFTGALIALPPSIFPVICPDVKTIGSRMGISWTTSAIAFLIGTPIAGQIIDLEQADLLGVQVWSGVMLLAGMFFLFPLWRLVSIQQKKIWI